MNAIDLLNTLNSKYLSAVDFHRNLSDLYTWLSLEGYAAWHSYQMADELLMQRKIKKFIAENYNMPVPDVYNGSVDIFENYTSNLSRDKIPADRRLDIIKQTWEKDYIDWENAALSAYEDIAKRLLELGDIVAFNFVGRIISEVAGELARVKNKVIELQGHEWDMPQITAEQLELTDIYSKRLNELRFGDELLR